MTDAKNEAPERIWIEDERPYSGMCHLHPEGTLGQIIYGVEYVRADLLAHEVEAHTETQAALRAFIADLDRANAALILAKEALSPLAVMADRYDPDDGDGDLECWSGLAVPKILHIRAARTALDAINKLGVK